MSLAPAPEEPQGELFAPDPFVVEKEQFRLAGGALSVNNAEEAELLRNLKDDQIIELRVFCTKKGYTREYGMMIHNLVVSDAVIDTE